MPEQSPRERPPGGVVTRVVATALAAALILLGALIWFLPYLTHKREVIASVAAPSTVALAEKQHPVGTSLLLTEFRVAPRQQACMGSVAVTPNSRSAVFSIRPVGSGAQGGPRLELVLSAPGYHATSLLAGGYFEGSVAVPLVPPDHALIASACFVNRGRSAALLDGTREPRALSRSTTSIGSTTSIAGPGVVGDIAVEFLDSPRRSLLGRLGEVFGHVSVLTDRLVPVWLVWLLAVLVALGVPLAVLTALYLALRADEAPAAS
jgi:hypothetical protein